MLHITFVHLLLFCFFFLLVYPSCLFSSVTLLLILFCSTSYPISPSALFHSYLRLCSTSWIEREASVERKVRFDCWDGGAIRSSADYRWGDIIFILSLSFAFLLSLYLSFSFYLPLRLSLSDALSPPRYCCISSNHFLPLYRHHLNHSITLSLSLSLSL